MTRAAEIAKIIGKGSVDIHGEAGTTSSGSTGKTTNLQQGLAKAFISFDGVGTAAAEDTFNSSLVTDHGTGQYTLGVTNNMASVNYIVTCETGQDNANIALGGWFYGVEAASGSGSVPVSKTTSQVQTKSSDTQGTQRDIENGGAVFHGDLAQWKALTQCYFGT